ncbi:MAG: FAD-dependent oxidoreductase [Clostridia bacterium]|nr:FAD-dependent oxidoreductase [Clostridia bacterium]
MIRISNIKVRADYSKDELFDFIYKKYGIKKTSVTKKRIVKKSIDARNKADIFYNYAVEVECENESKIKGAEEVIGSPKLQINVRRRSSKRPIIVGAGPAGLFAALILAKNGVKPIVIEQGKTVDERQKDVEEFLATGKLRYQSNVQFGEGGAGTFSDGKLTSGIHNQLCKIVSQEFYNFGAPEQILYINKPHIGTDNLINIVRNMRNKIIELGGTFLFNEKVVDFKIAEKKVQSVLCSSGRALETDSVILAIGHSARDTFEKLYEKGIQMERKNFSVGVRIEHKQSMINKSQYGNQTKLKLPPAEYKFAYHGEVRSCYTFCMCPGGVVMASSSEPNTIVTNGMSKFARDGENSNSAVLVNITPDDFEGNSPLAGIYFQKKLEEEAFKLGGGNYYAPIQRFEDFKNNVKSKQVGEIKPSYRPGVTLSNLNDIFPNFVSKTLVEGISYFGKLLKGFDNPDSILTGVETRSSSPVQIIRDESKQSNIKGIYPCGEGAGYAGGIMSAAVDGIKCAIAVLENE